MADLPHRGGQLVSFFEGSRRRLVDVARMCGQQSLAELQTEDLVTCDLAVARHAAVPHAAAGR